MLTQPLQVYSLKIDRFRACGGGYFFVMLITPKITTANRLSNPIISSTVICSPPLLEVKPFPSCLAIRYHILCRMSTPNFTFFKIFFQQPKAYPFSPFNLIIISGLFQLFSFHEIKYSTPASITHFTPLFLSASHYYNAALSFCLSCINYRNSILTNVRLLNIIEIR